jgi:peptide/nickel transport system substrate-binding protein
MLNSKKIMLVLGLLVIASMLLAACQPAPEAPPAQVQTVIVTVETEGGVETIIQVVTPTPEPMMLPDTLVICLGQEPDTLYNYSGAMLARTQVLEAIYDGPIDANTFAYEPVILEKLPSLADGDAILQTVTVSEGARVVDAEGDVITLDGAADPPQMLRVPDSDEPVEYTGGDVALEQLVVTFKLIPGLLWEDGTPLTAADSVYAFNLLADPDTPQSKFTIERTASYTASDDVTTVWTGLPGYYDATYYIEFFGPAPEHVWGAYTAIELLDAEESSLRPIGYGPYKIVEWTKGDNVRLVKNENYWRAGEGLPKFDNLVYRFLGASSNANIASVLSGECDIVDQTSSLEDQAQLLLELQAAGQLDASFVTGTVWEHADFTIQRRAYDDGYTPGVDPIDFFSDVRVRQGILHCMDRQAVVDTVMYGQSIVLDAYLPPNHPLFNAEVVSYEFDVAKGMALLADAGWTDTDGDGILDNGQGQALEFRYGTTSATQRIQATQILANSMAECGIKVNLEYFPASEWFADGPDGVLFGRLYELGQFAWLTGVEPACELYLSDLTPGPVDETWISIQDGQTRTFGVSGWGGQNNPGFANAEYDTACKAAISSLPGEPAYVENHLTAQRIFGEQVPVAPLYLRLKLAITRPDMCNFFMDPTNNSEMWNIEEFGYGPHCE